jgi:hypothetical protein
MKNKKVIIIAGTSIIVIGILFLAFKKAGAKDIGNDSSLKADYDAVIKKIDNAKK